MKSRLTGIGVSDGYFERRGRIRNCGRGNAVLMTGRGGDCKHRFRAAGGTGAGDRHLGNRVGTGGDGDRGVFQEMLF